MRKCVPEQTPNSDTLLSSHRETTFQLPWSTLIPGKHMAVTAKFRQKKLCNLKNNKDQIQKFEIDLSELIVSV